MAKGQGRGARGVVILGVAAALFSGVLWAATRVRATKAIQLYQGPNELTYTGPRQTAGAAMSSIIEYLEIAYYYDDATGQWVQILSDTVLEPYMKLSIIVTEDCVWVV